MTTQQELEQQRHRQENDSITNNNDDDNDHSNNNSNNNKGTSMRIQGGDIDGSSTVLTSTNTATFVDTTTITAPSTTTDPNNNTTNNNKLHLVKYLTEQHSDDWYNYNDEIELFIQEIPKIELHVHLDGSFDPDYIWEYIQQHPESIQRLPKTFIPPWDPHKELHIYNDVMNCTNQRQYHNLCTCRGQRSLGYMLNCFQYFLPIINCQMNFIEQLAYDFVQRQYEQNIIYTEVRYSPHLFTEGFVSSSSTSSNEKETTTTTTKEETTITADMIVQAVTAGLRRGVQQFTVSSSSSGNTTTASSSSTNNSNKIIVNQILCAITWRPEWALDVIELAKKYQNNYPCAVVGVDIAAGEEHFDCNKYPNLYEPHYKMAQQAKIYNIPLTLHAGETSTITTTNNTSTTTNNNNISEADTVENKQEDYTTKSKVTDDDDDDIVDNNPIGTNVRRAVEDYGARRIGHGYRIVSDVQLMKYVHSKNIHFEICPTSSDETGGWDYPSNDTKNWKEHPAVIMNKQHNISISLNSDDPAVFHTSLAWQYRLAITKMGFTQMDFIHMNIQAIDAAFGLSQQQRDALKQIIMNFVATRRIKEEETNLSEGITSRNDADENCNNTSSNFHQFDKDMSCRNNSSGNFDDTVSDDDDYRYHIHRSHHRSNRRGRNSHHNHDPEEQEHQNDEVEEGKVLSSSHSHLYKKAQSVDSFFFDRVYIEDVKI